MEVQINDLLYGFLAAAIAVLTIHELLVLGFKYAGVLPNAVPWSLMPTGIWNLPTILNSVFWGGLWGVVYVLVADFLPIVQIWVKGAVFGVLIALVSNFTLLALIKKRPLFMGFDFKLIFAVLIILSGFGSATAVLFVRLQN